MYICFWVCVFARQVAAASSNADRILNAVDAALSVPGLGIRVLGSWISVWGLGLSLICNTCPRIPENIYRATPQPQT